MGWPQSVALQPELELGQLIEQLARAHRPAVGAARWRVVRLGASTATRCSASRSARSAPTRAPRAFAGRAGDAHGGAGRRCCRARWPGWPARSRWPGRTGYVTLDMSPGYGYSGIVIAMLAGLHPLGVVAAARVRRRRAGRRRQHEPRGRRADLHRRRDRRGLADRRCWWRRCWRSTGCAGSMSERASTSCRNRRLLGRGAAHRHAADLRHAGRAAVRARRRAEPRHRRASWWPAPSPAGSRSTRGAPLWAGVAVAALTGAVFGLLHALADRRRSRCRSTCPGSASRCWRPACSATTATA